VFSAHPPRGREQRDALLPAAAPHSHIILFANLLDRCVSSTYTGSPG